MTWRPGFDGTVVGGVFGVALVELAKWAGRRRGSIAFAQEVRSKIYMAAEASRAKQAGTAGHEFFAPEFVSSFMSFSDAAPMKSGAA